jgi:integrase
VLADELRVSGWADPWLVQKQATVSLRTHVLYRGWYEHYIRDALGHKLLQQVMPAEITTLFVDLRDKLKPRTLRTGWVITKMMFADAQRAGLIVTNPCDRAVPPPAPRRSQSMRVWTAAQEGQFLQEIATEPDHAVFRLAATTGMRRSELLGATWESVNFDSGTLDVRQTVVEDRSGRPVLSTTKTQGSRRTIDLDPATIEALKQHRRHQLAERLRLGFGRVESDLVFCHPDGKPIPPQRLTARFAVLVKRSSLPRIKLHDLRHTHASLLLANGTPVNVVSERLGHADSSITLKIYAHLLPGQARDAALRLAALVDRASS